jgi:Helix-hairpin-helix motif
MTASLNRFRAPGIRLILISILAAAAGVATPVAVVCAGQGAGAPPVTVAGSGTAPAAAPAAGGGPPIRGAAGPGTARSSRQIAALSPPPPKPKVDLNRASEKQLETLPGIGRAAARKIIAARPYALVEDLARTGLAPEAIAKLAPFATAGPAAAPPTPASAPAAGGIPAKPGPPLPPASATLSAGALGTPAPVPPAPGMVWANPDSKTYHFPGERWYGKTRHGRYMTEADAVKAGYRAAKSGPKAPPR